MYTTLRILTQGTVFFPFSFDLSNLAQLQTHRAFCLRGVPFNHCQQGLVPTIDMM
jgi:hypothetical protein